MNKTKIKFSLIFMIIYKSNLFREKHTLKFNADKKLDTYYAESVGITRLD